MEKKQRRIHGGIAAAALLIACAAAFGIIWGQKGHISGAVRTIGKSERFPEAELESAADAMYEYFEQNLKGCTLLSVTYDEERSEAEKRGSRSADTVVLFSDFYAPHFFGSEKTSNIGGRQHDFKWILRKNVSGSWEVITYGYG
jgi:hypothetical protein